MQNHAQSCLKIKLPKSGGHKWDRLEPFNDFSISGICTTGPLTKTKCTVCGSILEVKLKISIWNGDESDIETKIRYSFQSSASKQWTIVPEGIEDCNQIIMQKALK